MTMTDHKVLLTLRLQVPPLPPVPRPHGQECLHRVRGQQPQGAVLWRRLILQGAGKRHEISALHCLFIKSKPI